MRYFSNKSVHYKTSTTSDNISSNKMKLLVVSALLSAALLVASSPVDSEERNQAKWENFKAAHGKNYHPLEEQARKTNFFKTDARITAHNSNTSASFRMVHNRLSDLHPHEFQALLGAVPPARSPSSPDARLVTDDEDDEFELDRITPPPASLDLRQTTKCVGPVKDQKYCGSCWAFSAIAPLEFSYCMKNRQQYVSLSEQQVVDCDRVNGGCNGGWPIKAYSYIQSAGGSELTAAYPYKAVNQNCTFSSSLVKAQVASFKAVCSNPQAIILALNKYGALSVCLFVTSNFGSYGSGVLSDPLCTCTPSNCPSNHCVANVGYGYDSVSKMDYWILRNSWSSGWGNKGYILVQRGVNMCGVENYVTRVSAK